MCCELGFLYNKEAVINALLEKSLNPAFSHIRGLKDIKTLNFTPNTNFSSEVDGEYHSKFICPITSVEFNGLLPFDVIWTTGVVLSDKAVREIGIAGLQADYGPFQAEDIVRLLPVEGSEEAVSQRDRLLAKRRNNKKESKANKRAHVEESTAATATSSSSAEVGNGTVTADGNNVNNNSSSKDGTHHHQHHKKHKHNAAEDTNATTSNGSSSAKPAKAKTNLSSSSQMVKSASTAIADQTSSSTVYKGLFHKDHEKDKYDRDLFMSVAGLRYTLG